MLILIGWQFQVRQPSDYIMNKTEFYADLNRDFNALMAGETSFLATLANTSALLYERLTDVNWAGFYLLEDDTLVLGPFQGKIACVRIPVGRGVCGTAVARNQVQRIEDVHAFDGHIACDATRLARLNERFKREGKPELKKLDDLPKDYQEPDPYLDETVNIALDLAKLEKARPAEQPAPVK